MATIATRSGREVSTDWGTLIRMPQRPGPPDLDALMRLVAKGDQDAFAALYDATSAFVFGIALRVCRDHARAEEVAQEVYVQVWQQAPRFDPELGAVRTWLNALSHRRAVDAVRSSERSRQRDDRWTQRTRTEVPDISEEVASKQDAWQVRAALERLPAAQRTAVVLAYFEGMTHVEVADFLHLPLGTVKTRIRAGMQRLGDVLGEQR